MSGHPETNFLDLPGFVHQITISPGGSPEDPWPFMLVLNDGQGETTALIHREDAEVLIGFLQRHLNGASA